MLASGSVILDPSAVKTANLTTLSRCFSSVGDPSEMKHQITLLEIRRNPSNSSQKLGKQGSVLLLFAFDGAKNGEAPAVSAPFETFHFRARLKSLRAEYGDLWWGPFVVELNNDLTPSVFALCALLE